MIRVVLAWTTLFLCLLQVERELPTFAEPAAAMQVDFSPLLYGEKYDANTVFILLGGVQAGSRTSVEQAAALIRGTSEYDVYPFSDEAFQVLGYAPETSPIRPGQYFIDTDGNFDHFGMLAVAHGWPVRQGRAEELSSDNEIYRQAIRAWLQGAGVPDSQLGTLRMYRVDLEGDGTNEIFLSDTARCGRRVPLPAGGNDLSAHVFNR